MSKYNISLKELEGLSDEEFEDIKEINNQTDKLKFCSKLLNKQIFINFIESIKNDNGYIQPSSLNKNNKTFNLINDCNKYVADINLEINTLIKTIKEIYSQRFPELESIVLSPIVFATTVLRLGNDIDVTKTDLNDILPNHNIMAINIMSSTTIGKQLKESDLIYLISLCEDVLSLNNYKKIILSYVENKINTIAPNLTALIGSNVAAKLIISAGGLIELSRMPACNVLVLGSQRINTEGFSTAGKLHKGYLSEIDEVNKTPEEYQKQLLRKYANKSVLAARVDAYRRVQNTRDDLYEVIVEKEQENNISNNDGIKLKEFISKKMDRIIEPKQPALRKPLPRPDDKPRRKRGGKRVRSMKQRYALTEMRALKNRMKFGTEAEVEFRDSGKGYGMLGFSGKVKNNVKSIKINTKKQKLIALESLKEDHKSGLYSSVSFTPAEGIKLINPELLENRFDKAKEKYFNAASGFTTVINSKKNDSIFDFKKKE